MGRKGGGLVPRPKPPEPYVSIVLRLTPGQAEKVRSWAKDHGQTVSDTFRAFVDGLPVEPADPPVFGANWGDTLRRIAAADRNPPMSRPKAAPGSRLKKR